MGGASIWHWLIVGGIVMMLFGRGKISEMMGDVAKGIKAFKKGMTDEDAPEATTAATVQPVPGEPTRTIEHRVIDPASNANSTLADRKLG